MLTTPLVIVVKDTILKAIHNSKRIERTSMIVVKDTILKAIHNLGLAGTY